MLRWYWVDNWYKYLWEVSKTDLLVLNQHVQVIDVGFLLWINASSKIYKERRDIMWRNEVKEIAFWFNSVIEDAGRRWVTRRNCGTIYKWVGPGCDRLIGEKIWGRYFWDMKWTVLCRINSAKVNNHYPTQRYPFIQRVNSNDIEVLVDMIFLATISYYLSVNRCNGLNILE